MTQRWTKDAIWKWHDDLPWLVGTNFVPSTAINQLEMWSADTFDAETIDRELGWAASIGMNVMRVYLHDIAWSADSEGFKARIDEYLAISSKHGIKTFLVFFDDCWHEPKAGVQPTPRPGIHNSGWYRSPGREKLLDQTIWADLEAYVRDIASTFKNDSRIVAWDIYNEVTNLFLPSASLPEPEREAAQAAVLKDRPVQYEAAVELMKRAFDWVRSEGVTQPLTSGIYYKDEPLNQLLIDLSDFVSFHHYKEPDSLEKLVGKLLAEDRPLWCTEYLSRRAGCFFETHMPLFKEHKIAAINWGLVDGKTQTKYAWSDQGVGEPDPWFHDVFKVDGTPYSEDEAAYIKGMTSS